MVDQCYLASVADLRNLCAELANYSVEVVGDRVIVADTNEGDLNTTQFSFPIVAAFWVLGSVIDASEVGKLVCLDRRTAKQTRKGLYLSSDGKVSEDPITDWKRFWVPLEALLHREIQELKPKC